MEGQTQKQIKVDRRTKRFEERYNRRVRKLTTSLGNQDFKQLATRYLKHEIKSDEWSLITPACRKKIIRFSRQIKKVVGNSEVLNTLPENAIIQTVEEI